MIGQNISTTNIIDRLKDIQGTNNYSDSQMAKLMGCSRQLWQLTRTGRTPLGITILSGGVKAFPELLNSAIYFLTGDDNIPSGKTKTTEGE